MGIGRSVGLGRIVNEDIRDVITEPDIGRAVQQAQSFGLLFGQVVLAPVYTGAYQLLGPKNSITVYDPAYPYNANDVIYVGTAPAVVYRSLQAGNTGHAPAGGAPWWAAMPGDATRILAVCNAYPQDVILAAGLWVWDQPNLQLPSNLNLHGQGRGVTNLVMALTKDTTPTNCCLFAQATAGNKVALSSNTVVGTNTCTVATLPVGGLAVEDPILIGNTNHWFQYRVKNIAGAGPYTITVDRNFRRVFTVAEFLQKESNIPSYIHVWDLSISGVGSRAWELVTSYRCRVARVSVFATDFGDMAASFDVGGWQNSYGEGVEIDANGKATNALAFESNEDSHADHVNVLNATSTGVVFLGCDACTGLVTSAHGCNIGGYMGQLDSGWGCQDCVYQVGDYTGNTSTGLAFNPNTKRGKILLSDCSDCGIGVSVYANCNDCECHSLTTNRCRNGGGIYFGGADSDLKVFGHTAWDCVNTATVYMNTRCTIDIVGFKWGNTMGDSFRGVKGTTDFTLVRLRQGSWDVSGAAAGGATLTLTELYGGLLDIEDVVQVGTKPGGGGAVYCMYQGADTALAQVGDGIRMVAGCTERGGGHPLAYNCGTFTLNGINEVDVAGNFAIGATIRMSLATVGSTPGNAPPYFSTAQAAGHFYVKSPTANANDVYNWKAL